MKAEIRIKKEVDIKTLLVEAGVRYWEDATVNGIEDENGDLIPCRIGDLWKPIIDVDSGVILNWEQGKKVEVHYKVCDAGNYYLKDENNEIVISLEDDYVPNILCPNDDGYGDYIIMSIDENGVIENWKPTISDFINSEE